MYVSVLTHEREAVCERVSFGSVDHKVPFYVTDVLRDPHIARVFFPRSVQVYSRQTYVEYRDLYEASSIIFLILLSLSLFNVTPKETVCFPPILHFSGRIVQLWSLKKERYLHLVYWTFCNLAFSERRGETQASFP